MANSTYDKNAIANLTAARGNFATYVVIATSKNHDKTVSKQFFFGLSMPNKSTYRDNHL
jgi:hypothetical protein